jgi:nucleotide-binding universal stress UspA family protein
MTENVAAWNALRPRGVVVGVDFSENSARAVLWAAHEAVGRGLALHVVHALDLPGAMSELLKPADYVAEHCAVGEMLLAKIAARVHERYPALALSSELSELGAGETLIVLSAAAQLVVTGYRGHGGFAGMLIGSTILEVAAYAHCPTVVVRGEDQGGPPGKILLGVEPGQADASIRFAFAAAAEVGAEVSAVRAWWPKAGYGGYDPPSMTGGRMQAQRADIADLLKPAREDYPQVNVSTHVVSGNRVSILVGAALGAHLVVVGAQRHRGPLSMGAGYVVRGLLAHSPAPVAVVPAV